MLKAFRSNTIVQLTIILVVTVVLWLPAFINPVGMPEPHSYAPLYTLLYSWLGGLPVLATSVALIVVVVSALVYNLMLTGAQLVSNTTLLPTLLYIVAMSVTPKGLTLTPLVLVSALMVICTSQLLLKGTLLTIKPEKTFGITALIGISTMIYMPAYSLLLSFLLIVIVYRLYNWRDWVVMVLGFIAPYILLATYLYITDGLIDAWQQLTTEVSNLAIVSTTHSIANTVANGYIVLLLIVALFATMGIVNERTVVIQKSVTAVSLFMVAGIIMLCYTQIFPVDMQAMALPFALQTTFFLQNKERSKRHWIWDTVLVLTILAAVTYTYTM